MENSEIFVETINCGKPALDRPVRETRFLGGKSLSPALAVGSSSLALDEGKNISRGYFGERLLGGVQEDLEIIPIAYPCIEAATVLEKLKVGIYLGHSQGYTYNTPMFDLPL
jgi:hypothetical protein